MSTLGDQQITVNISKQLLRLYENGFLRKEYRIATAKNGLGELMGSECTPRGWHKIRAKIGAGLPTCSVFVGRRPTGEIYSEGLAEANPKRDWILSRILWLGGCEPGKNRYKKVDTTWRYIYIHGCPDEYIKGEPNSHGCIRMKNNDVIDLFNRIDNQVKVWIG